MVGAATPLEVDLTGVYSIGLRLTTDGRIVDFLNPELSRPNTPEERVRQVFARKLHFDYGYPKDVMSIEVPIYIGSERRSADIVVFADEFAAAQRDQAQIKIVVETKAPDEKRGEAQLQSYIFASSAEGGVWINETDAPKYWRRAERQKLTTWPNLPRHGELWDSVGTHTKAALKPPHNLVETFRRCHNAMYRQGIDSEDIAMDMVRIILAKYQDESNEGDECEFRCTPDELKTADGRHQVAERIRALFRESRANAPEVFDPSETISAGDREIAIVVAELQDFRFVPPEDSDELYDVVGAAYEVYVGAHLKGDRGQYFTPRLIVQLLTRIVAPDEKATILDPAMGSGGFLITAMRQITSAINRSNRTARAKRDGVRSMQKRLYGIDQSPKLVKVARMNMILASDGHAGLTKGDSLRPLRELPSAFPLKSDATGQRPTVILTNPPFGATMEHRITPDKDPDIVAQFDLAHVWKPDADGKLRAAPAYANEGAPPEYLFLERCVRWLAPGGKLGIVLPRGLLDNDKALPLRTLLLRETRIQAVINCHDDTFKPHTDAKAALIYCVKKDAPSDEDDDYPIYMAISQGIGHDGLGKPIVKTDSKGDPILLDDQPVLDQDTEEIAEGWRQLRQGGESPSEYYFMATRRQLSAALNLNPVRYLPRYSESRKAALELGEQEGWTVEHLGQIAQVFNGPRFKRPYADKGVTEGEKIVPYFTGNAVTQTRGENVKFLDLEKAKPVQLKMIDKLYMRRGMLLITDSGTVGRVIYTTNYHDGAIGTNNLIRVVIDDEALRGYVYQFLLSPMGQNQLKANIYGAIVDHIEPDEVKQVIVPIPTDRQLLEDIGLRVIEAVRLQEVATDLDTDSNRLFATAIAPVKEDAMPKKAAALKDDKKPEPAEDEQENGITRDEFFNFLSRIKKDPPSQSG